MNKKLVGSAVIGAAVLAIVAAQFVGGGEDAPAAAPPSPSSPSITEQSMEAYNFPDAAGGRGWAVLVPVPSGWTVTHENDRSSYRKGNLLLETDKVPIAQEDALSGLKAIAAKAHQDGSSVRPVQAGDIADAAEWDYTYLRDGRYPERVAVIGIGAGDSLVTIRYEAPPAEFDANRGVLDTAMKVSAPG
ncbi:hypothetical protein SAMN04489727_9018 [Amycolatopsis tolypomycina]|uniref:Uncharacterized protein n=1 Tax=Amycolatopsis tolypomycina TaxID=208445 RepID=A0A1H5CWX3_9PSEU|nr:hypothetical protein [Amycolatopsis tolypomycina]SED70984.1 hypothetical protein SAMN04489727_9018 [Amycolatopsis tolypomycina]